MSSKNTPSKAQQARELTGDHTGQELEPLRSGLLIAWWHPTSGKVRVYWPKSVYPTLEDAQAALKAAGLPTGMDFTQYRAAGPFQNLLEIIQAAQPAGPSQADIDSAVTQLQKELSSPEMAAALEATEALVDADDSSTGLTHDAPAKKVKASGSKAKKAPAKKAKKAPAQGSWASRNPEQVATIPAAIKAGQHPQTFADANGISLAIAWRLFKAEGWVATGKGGGARQLKWDDSQKAEAHTLYGQVSKLAQALEISPAALLRAVERDS